MVDGLCDKLIYRHPHVYGDIHADTPDDVKRNWEALKLRKKNRRSGTLGGVPVSLPAMVKALRIGEKAAGAGFDWERREDVWAKVREETAEVETEMRRGDHEAMEGSSATSSSRWSTPAGSTESIPKPHSNAPTASSSAASQRWRKPLPDRGVCSPI